MLKSLGGELKKLFIILSLLLSLSMGQECEGVEVELWGECYNIEETTELNLHGNNLAGEIPSEIGNLINLYWLDLGNSGLTGAIPPEIGNLLNLTHLKLENNNLIGEIPSEIGNLTNLQFLLLHENNLTGEIPSDIGNLINLYWLILNENQLTGSIPPEIGNLTNLYELSLRNNQFNGSIASEIGNLVNLGELKLRWNDFTGLIPEEICDLMSLNLHTVYLDGNNFCPPYPDCLSESNLGQQDCCISGYIDECGVCGGSGIPANSSIRANDEYVASTGFGLGDYVVSYQDIEGFVIANTFQLNLEYQAGVDSDAVDVG